MSKLEKMIRFLPNFYKANTNSGVRGTLYAWSGEDDKVVQAIKDARDQLFVLTAQLQYLDALGSNVGVFRPTAFNLADALYRKLIPTLSYHPKQVKPTIAEVLGVFFGEGNPIVQISEVNPNEIVIQIPGAVPALRRTLRGSHHFQNYSGSIVSIDNVLKQMTVAMEGEKTLKQSELYDGYFCQGLNSVKILDNSEGNTNIIVQLGVGEDLSLFDVTKKFVCLVKNYNGSFIKDPTRPFSVRGLRGILGQSIVKGNIYPTISMQDASSLPNSEGYLIFNLSYSNEESMVKYLSRPNNTTLLIDPIYSFQQDHGAGEVVNLIETPPHQTRIDGSDYAIYVVGVEAARILAQDIIQSVVASGVVIRWIVKEPIC